jgi:hypothetical protein
MTSSVYRFNPPSPFSLYPLFICLMNLLSLFSKPPVLSWPALTLFFLHDTLWQKMWSLVLGFPLKLRACRYVMEDKVRYAQERITTSAFLSNINFFDFCQVTLQPSTAL